MLSELTVSDWRQFASVHIAFHERLTVLTGANGSGKTTLLKILAATTGWKLEFIGRRSRDVKRRLTKSFDGKPEVAPRPNRANHPIGSLAYSDGKRSTLVASEVNRNSAEGVDLTPSFKVEGLFVPSHRPMPAFLPVNEIPTALEAREQLYERYVNAYRQQYSVNVTIKSTPAHRIKSSLISLATFGYGNAAVTGNVDAVGAFEGFQSVLSMVLPASLGFQRLSIDVPDVLFETATGTFPFDAASGGILAIIDLAWQIFLCSQMYSAFVVVIDEPENHLHPQLQRSLLPDFTRAFPQTQFVVATHSPLVVSSVMDSNVYVLNYNEQRRVESQQLDLINRAGSSNEILRDVLGVPFTGPEWAEDKLAEVVRSYLQEDVTEDLLRRIRTEMENVGLKELFPEAVERVMERDGDSNTKI